MKMNSEDYEILCDVCGESKEMEDSSFEDCRSFMKEEGWKTFRENNEWINKCPECIGKKDK